MSLFYQILVEQFKTVMSGEKKSSVNTGPSNLFGIWSPAYSFFNLSQKTLMILVSCVVMEDLNIHGEINKSYGVKKGLNLSNGLHHFCAVKLVAYYLTFQA